MLMGIPHMHSCGRAAKVRNLDGRLSGDRNSSGYACFSAFLSNDTVLSDFPHSRQTRLARGVISPQNGHILCDRISCLWGLTIANNVPRNSRADVNRRRREGRYGSINFTFTGLFAESANLRQLNDDRGKVLILCRIAHIALILRSAMPRVY